MRHKKIKGKVGQYPTHYVELCPNCDAALVKSQGVKKCLNCKYTNKEAKFNQDDFIVYTRD